MRVIKIVIERSKDAFWAYAENVEGINGVGDSVQEVKESVLNCIDIVKGFDKVPKALQGDYRLAYKFDSQSLFNYYKGLFNKNGLAKLTGISQAQLQHYSSGIKKPRAAQAKKIETAIHQLGAELLSLEL